MNPLLFFRFLFTFFLVLLFCPHLLAQDEASPENWVIEKIECQGNNVTSCQVMQNELYLAVGDQVDEEEIENARLRLKTTGLFYEANISLQKGSARGQVILVIDVQERSGHYVNLGASAGMTEKTGYTGSSGSIHVGDRNLLGLGKRLDIGFSKNLHSVDQDFQSESFEASYEDPNLFGNSKYFAALNYRSNRQTDYDSTSNFESVDISLGRRIFDFSYLKAGHNISKSQFRGPGYYYYRYNDGVSEIKSAWNYLEYGWNTKDDLFFPTSGSSFQLGAIFPRAGRPNYYIAQSWTKQLSTNYFLELAGEGSLSKTYEDPYELSLQYGAQVARYFTFHRQGIKVPDKMKLFAGVDTPVYNKYTVYSNANLGVSYLIDSFGDLSLTLGYQAGR